RPARPPPFPYTTLFRSVGGSPAGLGAHLREAEGDDAVVGAVGLAAAPGGGPRVRAARAEREQGCGRGRREDGAGQGGTCHVSSSDRKSTRLNSSHVKIS